MSDTVQHDDRRFTRRQLIKTGALTGAALAGSSALGGVARAAGLSAKGEDAASADTLNIFTWSSYHDAPWIKEYEKLRGVKIKTQLIGSVPEGFAKTKASPGSYDLVLATAGWVETYADAGLIVPVDESKVPNIKNINPAFNWRQATKYKGKNWAVVYNWGDEPLCWLPSKVKPTPNSWKVLWDPQYKGKVSLVDDPTTILPFIPMMLGFKDPYKLTSSQFKQFQKKLNELRGQLTHVTASIDDQTADFANGQVVLGVLYNISTQVKLKQQGINLLQKIPVEGAPAWSDNYVITKAGAKKADLAYDFIDYTLSVPWQGRFIAASSNTGVLSLARAKSKQAVAAGLNAKALATTLIPYTAGGASFFRKLSLLRRVPNLDDWLNAWNEFKLGLG
jgi:spermidine/putrescine transport system substrate-binding protein